MTTSEARPAHDAPSTADKPEGPISAAIIAAGIGALALGIVTTLAEASTTVKEWLEWSTAVGPLAGKVGVALIVWIAAWIGLHAAMRHRPRETRTALIIALCLIALGVLGTFPPFFGLFAAE